MFIDNLIDKIKELNNPSVAGLDPKLEYIPDYILNECFEKYGETPKACGKAIKKFNYALIDAIYDIVPAIKPQLAYYEMYGIYGLKAYVKTIEYARSKGMLVITDGKRNDIGSTSKAYSNAYLGNTKIKDISFKAFESDALTVNPYLGIDGIQPFIEDCIDNGKGIFALVKTSNPSSGQLQDLKFEDGRTVYETVADMVDEWGKQVIGEYGYSSVGAVVGATWPEQAASLRKRMKNTFFLVPGYGAQGGTAESIKVNFNDDGLGAIVNASRSFMCAYRSDRWSDKFSAEQFADAARAEMIRMRDDINSVL